MTTVVLARVIGADKVRRRPFKAGARATAKRQAAHSPGATQPAPAPTSEENSRPIKAKQDSTARVLPCVNCAWAQSVVGYSLLQGGADG